jgi:hypothetical protein
MKPQRYIIMIVALFCSANSYGESFSVTPISIEDYEKTKLKHPVQKEVTIEDHLRSQLEQNKASFYRIYNRELRKNPELSGEIEFDIIVTEDGQVHDVRIVRSSLNHDPLEAKLIARTKLMNFGKIESAVKITWPITFIAD